MKKSHYSCRPPSLSSLAFWLKVFLLLGLCLPTKASEVDQETYANLPLRDAAPEINRQINLKLETLITEINSRLKTGNPLTISDNQLEYFFATEWKNRLASPWSSEFEDCIPKNNCPGWEKIDRINLIQGESIYDKADFNIITTRYITAVIEACGVRFGVDKLTHMFQDGFRFYDLWMNQTLVLDEAKVFEMSLEEERHIMGRSLTDVVSYGDIYANLAGFNLFRSLFAEAKHMQRDSAGYLRLKKPVNVCEHISPLFDERVSKVEYYGEQAEILQKIIRERRQTHSLTWSAEGVQQILNRPETRSVGFVEIAVGVWALIRHPEMTSDIYWHFPKVLTELEQRRPIHLDSQRQP